MNNRPKQFALAAGNPLIAELERRGEVGGPLLWRELERYYSLLSYSLSTIHLSVEEASLIVDALNGVALRDPVSVQMLHEEIADQVAELASKWGVDGSALAATVRSWTLAQKSAVADAVEQFWLLRDGDIPTRLLRVGLVRRG